jgi:hypothetical protein
MVIERTIYVFVPDVLETKRDNLIRRGQDLLLVDVAVECVP